MSSRYIELYATSPSGKMLFVCKFCGRTTPTPDKECPTPPSVVSWKQILPCIVLEEMAEVMKEVAESIGPHTMKNNVHYDVTLQSASVAVVSWTENKAGVLYPRKKHLNVRCSKLDELVEAMHQLLKTEPTELERKHL